MRHELTNRARIKDDDIFVPSAAVPTEEIDRNFRQPPTREVYCFTISGHHDYLDGDDNPVLMDMGDEEAEDRDIAFAKITVTKRGTRYYIKRGPNGRLFNPLGIMDEWTHNKERHGTGKKQWGYHEVGLEAFQLYLKFLRTKNTAYHKNAEKRGILMVKKGRLNNTEKYAIQGMIGQDMSIEDIASELDRSEKIITNYVNGELTELLSTVEKARRQTAENNKGRKKKRKRYTDIDEGEIHRTKEEIEDETVIPEIQIDPRIEREAYHQLVTAGLTERDASRVIKAAVKSCVKAKTPISNAKALFTHCIRRMNAGHFITKKTQGGNEGVAVMSSAASQRMDEARKRNQGKIVSRSARGNIYNPNTGEIE